MQLCALGESLKMRQVKKVADVDSNDVTLIPELVYYFVQEGCKSQGMAFEMDVDDFFGMIEISDLQKLSEAVAKVMGGTQKKQRPRQAVDMG